MHNETGDAQLINLTGRTFSNIWVPFLQCAARLSSLPGYNLQGLLPEPQRTQRPHSQPPAEMSFVISFIFFEILTKVNPCSLCSFPPAQSSEDYIGHGQLPGSLWVRPGCRAGSEHRQDLGSTTSSPQPPELAESATHQGGDGHPEHLRVPHQRHHNHGRRIWLRK